MNRRLRRPVALLLGLSTLVAGCGASSNRSQALCQAIARRDAAGVQRILAQGEISFTATEGGCTPVAAVFGAARPSDHALTAIGMDFIRGGMDPHASWVRPSEGPRISAMTAAAGHGNAELVGGLLAVGFDVRSRESGRALAAAAEAGHVAVVRLLVEAGADVNANATPGEPTPLSRAQTNGHTAVAEYLASKGAT